MGYQLTHYDFKPFPGKTYTDEPNPKYGLIGGKAQYKLTIEATNADDFIAKDFYFNPALFKALSIPTSNNPSNNLKGWFGSTNGLATGVTQYPMTLVTGGGNEESEKNYACTFEFSTNTKIYIYFDFYMVYDLDEFITASQLDNGRKFLYNKKTANQILNNTSPSVYNSKRSMWFYFFCADSNDASIYQYFYGKPGDVEARFYGVGNANGAPDYPLTSLSYSVDGNPATGIGSNSDTEVTFAFTGGGAAPGKVYGVLYRSDDIDNTIDYKNDVVLGFGEIVTNAGTTAIDGAIKNPAVKSFAGGTTTVKFNIDHTKIASGGKYYIALQVYDIAAETYTTHISAELSTFSSAPAAVYPTLVSDGIKDYLNDYGPSLKCAPQERLKSHCKFDTAPFNTAITAKYGSGSYNTLLKNVTLRIIDVNSSEILYAADLNTGVTRTNTGTNAEFANEFRVSNDYGKEWSGRSLRLEWTQEFYYPKSLTGLDDDHTDYVVLNQFLQVRCYDNDVADCVDPNDYGTTDLTLSKCNGIIPLYKDSHNTHDGYPIGKNPDSVASPAGAAFNQAAQFDGVNNAGSSSGISLGKLIKVVDGANPWSIEFTGKTIASVPQQTQIMGKWTDGVLAQSLWQVYFDSVNHVIFQAKQADNTLVTVNVVQAIGSTDKIQISYDGTNVRILKNGFLAQTQAVAAFAADTQTIPLLLGRCSIGTGAYTPMPWNGVLDELRFSNVARNTAGYVPATAPFIDDANTIGLYHLDEQSQPVVFDPLSNMCGQDCVAAYAFRRYTSNAKVIAYLDSKFYGTKSIKEEEIFSGQLQQKLNDVLYNVPEDYADAYDSVFFRIDGNQLLNDVQYRASVTLKYTAPLTTEI